MPTRFSPHSTADRPLPTEKVSIASWPSSLITDSALRRAQLFHGDDFTQSSPDDDFTRLDLFNTVGISIPELRIFMAKRLQVKDIGNNLDQKLSELQAIYDESLSFMERVLYLKIPLGLRSKKWNSINEFIEVVKGHTDNTGAGTEKKNGAYSIMFCAILKTMVVESDVHRNPKIDQLDQDLENLNSHLKSSLGLKEVKRKGKKKSEYEPKYIEYILDGHTIRVASRAKTRDAIRLKELFKRKYQSVEDFGDLLGIEIELDESLGIDAHIHIISRVKQALYGKSKTHKVDGSWQKIPVTLQVKGSILTSSAIKDIEASGEIKVSKKKHSEVSSLDFEDIKFTPAPATIKRKDGKHYTLKPEVRFVKSGNRNESGFAAHDVMDLKRVITANVRLFGALTLGNLRYILDKFPYENHADGTPKTTAEIIKSRHAMLDHLLYPEGFGPGNFNSETSMPHPFLRILSNRSTQSGEQKIYVTTNNVLFSEDGEYSLTNIYSQYPPPVSISSPSLHKILERVHIAVNGALTAKVSSKSPQS